MVRVLTKFLTRAGYRVWHEVPNMGQSADVVAKRGKFLTFVEAKLADWRRALEQCRAHHHVADYICIAITGQKVSEELMQEAANRGYGVIHFDRSQHSYRWLRRPDRNTGYWPPQRRRLDEVLKDIGYAG